jgi:glycosyltransferase involved in cell wall biosynthesis
MDGGGSVKKILFFTHAHPQGYRIQQYFPFLEKRGFEVELATTQLSFLALLDRVRTADVIYIQRILLSPLKLALARTLAKTIVYDFDDAVMYGAKGESSTRERKFRKMVGSADAVLCGNRFLLKEAGKWRDRGAYYIPTVVDTTDYPVKAHEEGPVLTVGWMGSSSTLKYLSEIMDLLSSMASTGRVTFKIVADRPPEVRPKGIIFERWNSQREKAALLSFDVGVMPLRDDVWSRGKCGLKLIQYMAAGLPAITHPFGVAPEIIEDGVNGFLRKDGEGWKQAIEDLAADVALRKRVGAAARQTVEEKYELRSWGPRVAEIIESL